jgi:hypothetical protein
VLVIALGPWQAAAQRIERFPEQFGPFALGPNPGQKVTVVGVFQRLLDAKEYWRSTTLEYWSIQNESRAILTRGRESTKTQPPGEYVEARGLSAHLLEGHGRPMVLLVFGVVPSPPTSGVTYRVFGFDRAGVFREALRLQPYGDGVMNTIDSATGKIALTEGRYLDVSEWLGAFGLRIRYEYDEATHRFLPRNSCGPPLNPLLDREAARNVVDRGLDPRVELHDAPKASGPRKVLRLTERSQIRLIEACIPKSSPHPATDVWLKVEIDGMIGWAHDSEFPKLGLGGI